MTSFLGNGERRYYRDGDEENGEQERGWTEQEDGWQKVRVETVECDVPITVYTTLLPMFM